MRGRGVRTDELEVRGSGEWWRCVGIRGRALRENGGENKGIERDITEVKREIYILWKD